MIGLLTRRPTAVFLLIAGYFLLNVIVRLFLPHSLELDEAEQVFLSQWLALGYGPQPPFYNWLQQGIFSIFGTSVATLSIVKNLVLFLSYFFYGLTAFKLLSDKRLAVIAALGLLTIPQISFEAQRDLAHTVAVIFSSSLFFYMLVSTIQRPTAAFYALTGLAIGIGAISKYNFVLVPAAALLAMLCDPDLRRFVFDRRLVLTIIVAAIVILPHGFWILDNLRSATESTLGKMTESDNDSDLLEALDGGLSLLLAVLGFSALTALIFLGLFGKAMLSAFKAGNIWTRLIERTILFCLAAVILMIVFGGAEHIKDRWLAPMLLPLPLYLCLKAEAAGLEPKRAFRGMITIAAGIMLAVPAVLYGRVTFAPVTGVYKKLNVPYAALITTVSAQAIPSIIIAEDDHLAGNLRFQLPSVPVQSARHRGYEPEVTWTTGRPGLLIWRAEKNDDVSVPSELMEAAQRRFAVVRSDIEPKKISIPYIFGPYVRGTDGDRYDFGYAWVYPKASG
ncbi:4-amino-4-deoxy-L-arabinose transferase-like glycosyltransferase [Pararhizobium capsulatum DSM 1112]|uniref:4-amino-4-deoxy-L-arabinose transferase-like glycosyltransferase n=1 Tax=Pararhizobium capsulatum DSM 1112 TaxID=1121113 RepID=A0ABU0BNZ0_9HYPH|nr:glycosyltransferase family 39 protein [Pararhizobium capsulatum]MDQ0319643.1 4-amino-4-deoxy-L-arabinose transferase-like glycosyltransferase [Pararhizobium capsulatum DSM 1112]